MIYDAIKKINPEAKITVYGTNLDTCKIEWNNGTTPISKADIEAKIPEVEFDIAMADLRTKRNRLLQESDWEITSELEKGNAISSDMKKYRQDLRDLPAGKDILDKVNNATWPTKP